MINTILTLDGPKSSKKAMINVSLPCKVIQICCKNDVFRSDVRRIYDP